MIVKAPSVQASLSPSNEQQNHRQPQLVRALRWFWRFSQFYGEYTVRSPRARQQWLAKKQIEQKRELASRHL